MDSIKTLIKNNCSICGSEGTLYYRNLTDKLFGAPGEWNLYRCSNTECNLIWLNPMPAEEDIYIAYKDYYTHVDEANSESAIKKFYKKVQTEYLASKYGYGNAGGSLLKNILYLDPDRLEQTKYDVMYLDNIKGKLLDVGCGSGVFLEFMKKYGWDVYGVDFDEKAVATANAKNLKVKLGNLKEQNFSNDYFDAITLSHVIEHIYDPVELLKECSRILKKNGKIVISTPNTESFGHKYFGETWRGFEPPRHINVFSKKSLALAIKSAGFSKYNTFTTGRISRHIYRSSGELQQNSRTLKLNNSVKIKARLFSIIEMILLQFKKDCGEEVVIIAEK